MIRDTSQQDQIVTTSKSKKKWVAIAAISIAGVVFAGQAMSRWLSVDHSVSKAQVRFATVERGDLFRDISASGKVVAANAPVVYSAEQGLVTLRAKPGDLVKADQVVAVINSPILMAELQQQQTAVQRISSDVNRAKLDARRQQLALQQRLDVAKVDLSAAERESRRATISIERELISQIDFEKAQDDLAKSQLSYSHAKQEADLAKDTLAFEIENKTLELKTQQLMLSELERKIRELEIRSPVDGIVGNWLVEQKAKVQRNQSLMKIVDLSAYDAEVQVPESYADELGLGMSVEINVAGNMLMGQLSSISPEVRNNQVTARVRINSENDVSLRQNQRVNARIILEQKESVLMVRRGQFYSSGAGKVAYKVNGDNALRIEIESGATSMSHIELLNGVEEGDTIVISNIDAFDNKPQVFLR
ncbi:efflux RND transporter periplasmic adaptor subunit [Thalassotalea fusca]